MVDVLRRHLTWSEEKALEKIAREIPTGGPVIVTRLADDGQIQRSTVTNALKKASMAGIIDCRSMGRSGTMIVVRDSEAWSELGRREAV